MAQRTAMDEVRAWLTPILVLLIGYLLDSRLTDITEELRSLRENIGTHDHKLQRLENKVFGFSDQTAFIQRSQPFFYDKNKILHYDCGVFYYA